MTLNDPATFEHDCSTKVSHFNVLSGILTLCYTLKNEDLLFPGIICLSAAMILRFTNPQFIEALNNNRGFTDNAVNNFLDTGRIVY